jgi:hypothetical protein
MAESSIDKLYNTIPKSLRPQYNRVISALLNAIALSDDNVSAAIGAAKDQLFIPTASGTDLDRAANSLGVQRPATLGLNDTDFQNLIPNLSLKPKTIRKAFYDTADVFWGPLFSRANINGTVSAPFYVMADDTLIISIDNEPLQTIKVLASDYAAAGLVTAKELQAILGRIKGATVTIQTDAISGNQSLNIRTNTPGSVGAISIESSSLVTKLGFKVGTFSILNLDQRVAVYNITNNELLIELPSIVPALRRTLKGSHHFHPDSTLAGPVPTANGIWQGSFFFDPNGTQSSYTISGQKAALNQSIQKGSVYPSVAVSNNSLFLNPSGSVVFGYGTMNEEGPVLYRGIPNTSTVLIDPGYTFRFDHVSGESINVVSQNKPYTPQVNGKDLAIYLTSPSSARAVVQTILSSLAAAGITINFVVLSPHYKYLISNPYTE